MAEMPSKVGKRFNYLLFVILQLDWLKRPCDGINFDCPARPPAIKTSAPPTSSGFCMRQVLFRTPAHICLVRKLLVYKRTMSTKPQFLVLVNDFPGTIQKRIEVRQAHLSVVGQNQAVRAGGSPGLKSHVDICRRILFERAHTRGSYAICSKIVEVA